MTTYVVFEHKVLGKKAVKNGFSAGGGFITLLWSLYHKMWMLSVILFIWASIAWKLNDVFSNINKGDPGAALASQFISYHIPALLIFGFGGNGFLRSRLAKQGYEEIAKIEAMSPEDALAKTAGTSSVAAASLQQPEKSQQPSSDLAAQISKLNDLRQQGAISEEEYQSAKNKLLK